MKKFIIHSLAWSGILLLAIIVTALTYALFFSNDSLEGGLAVFFEGIPFLILAAYAIQTPVGLIATLIISFLLLVAVGSVFNALYSRIQNKKLVIAVYAIVYVVAAVYFVANSLPITVYQHYSSSSCSSLEDLEDKDFCFKNAAIKEDDLSVCEQIDSINIKEDCIGSLAFSKKDITLCNKLSDSGVTSVYDISERAACIITIAVDMKDPDMCDKNLTRTQEKDYCYSYKNFIELDPSICNRIVSAHYKNECLQGGIRRQGS